MRDSKIHIIAEAGTNNNGNLYQAKELVQALKRNRQDVSFCEIEADCGHDAFLIDDAHFSPVVKRFLDASDA